MVAVKALWDSSHPQEKRQPDPSVERAVHRALLLETYFIQRGIWNFLEQACHKATQLPVIASQCEYRFVGSNTVGWRRGKLILTFR